MRADRRSRSREADEPIRLEEIARPRGGTRSMTRLDARDARRYEEAVGAIVPAVERALTPWVFANRSRPVPGGVALAPWGEARRRYERAIAAGTTGPWRAAFVGDVARCYPSIGARTVRDALRNLGVPEAELRRVIDLLAEFQDRGVPGLPVGPTGSAVVANAVLAPVDRALTRTAGRPALWWVDDVVVFTTDLAGARRARSEFDRSLERIGLAAHPSKTGVVADPAALGPIAARASALAPIDRGMMRAP